MDRNLFGETNTVDLAFLNDAYADDAETAASVFEQYLQDLPASLEALQQSFQQRNIEQFRHIIHKQKPGFSYVGLTDVSGSLHDLQQKCHASSDLDKFSHEIEAVIERIRSSASDIRNILTRLQAN